MLLLHYLPLSYFFPFHSPILYPQTLWVSSEGVHAFTGARFIFLVLFAQQQEKRPGSFVCVTNGECCTSC